MAVMSDCLSAGHLEKQSAALKGDYSVGWMAAKLVEQLVECLVNQMVE